jgi:hypothetical protein
MHLATGPSVPSSHCWEAQVGEAVRDLAKAETFSAIG